MLKGIYKESSEMKAKLMENLFVEFLDRYIRINNSDDKNDDVKNQELSLKI